jgi:hypothetical protein
MAKKAEPDRLFGKVYVGPRVTCSDCGELTWIKLGSFLGEVKDVEWPLPMELGERIVDYVKANVRGAVFSRYLRENGAFQKDAQGNPLCTFKVIKKLLCNCGATEQAYLFWVELAEHVYLGPWCHRCLEAEEKKNFGERMDNVPVYVVPVQPSIKFFARDVELDLETGVPKEQLPQPASASAVHLDVLGSDSDLF